jgi:biopolymer transport protein ExbD
VFSERRDSELRIDISPLIDVVFLLLIFFMVTTTFNEQQAVDIELPSARGEAQRADRDLPELALDKSGVVRLDGTVVDVEALGTRLRDLFESRPDAERVVIVRGDREATWELGLKVFSQLREADVTAASALTEPRPAGEGVEP